MNFNNLNTYNDSHQRAFEALINQLFERWVRTEYLDQLRYFSTVNGAGGDGGVEAYASLGSGDVVGVQAKWFRTSLTDNQIGQIKKSIVSAKTVRSNVKRYIICVPRDFQSIKQGRGKKIIKDSEDKRVKDLIDEVRLLYPDLELEFWNEHRIREELQKPGNEGILMFWFDKEEISIDFLQQKFELAKTGWLKERYIPSLHYQGIIQDKTEEILFTPLFRESEIKKINTVIKLTKRTTSTIEKFNSLNGAPSEFISDLRLIKDNLTDYLHKLIKITEALKNGVDSNEIEVINEFGIGPTMLALEDRNLPNTFKNLKPKLIRELRQIHEIYLGQYISDIIKKNKPHNYIIFGEPGTGKTHGVAKAVENRLDSRLPALIIRVKGTPSDNWASILQSTLGGLNNWSDEQIFTGLEALAVRADLIRARTPISPVDCENEPTKVLICIDGVDEAENISSWKIRINEIAVWTKKFPRLRFLVTSRHYVPNNMNPCDLDITEINRDEHLYGKGDAPLDILVPRYLKEYNINYKNALWITGTFENALSLRLFCEEYKDQDISTLQKPVTFGLGALLNAKIERIESEFFEKMSPAWSKTDQVLKKALFHLAEALQNRSFVDHDFLCQHLTKEFDGLIDRKWASNLLDTFCNHGVILKRELPPEDGISPYKIDYTVAYQSYLDFFIAIRATQEIINSGMKNIPEILRIKNDRNSLILTATLLLNDHKILVGEDGYWTNDLEEDDIMLLKFSALKNASNDVVKEQIPLIRSIWLESTKKRNAVLFQFIIPNLNRRELNLGISFIHDTLINFPSAFERDISWSSPDNYNGKKSENIGTILSNYYLLPSQRHDELPIVFAWSLSTTNNIYREHCRSELTKWGYKNPKEFIEILNMVFFCGDPQIQEDLATILLGISSLINSSGKGLRELSDWLNNNIFDNDKIQIIRNSVIRHCSRSLMEKAFSLGECNKSMLKKSRPPYKTNNKLLLLDLTDNADSRGERFPIVHDLAWYVIDDGYKGFLDYTMGKKTNVKGEKLLQKYRKKYKKDIGPYEFSMSAAIAFIKQLGWKRENGPGMTEATHGSKSRFATLEEKYTWLAVHEMQGYLSDLIPYKKENKPNKLIEDYNLIVHVPNPVKNEENFLKVQKKLLNDPWYIPYDISPILKHTEKTIVKDIREWVHQDCNLKFNKWININTLKLSSQKKHSTKWLSLYMSVDLAEPNNIGRTSLELICCLINKDQFKKFIKYFKANKKHLKSWPFGNIDHFEAKPNCATYSSVRDIVNMNWIEEKYSNEIIEKSESENFNLIKSVTEVVENSIEQGDSYFKIPSKYIRNKLEIVDSDRNRFWSIDKKLNAIYYTKGEIYYDEQKFLIIDKDKFYSSIKKDNLVPFWIGSQIRNTTIEFKKRRENIHFQKCQSWLIWNEKSKLMKFCFHKGRYKN